ncbi:hypothetical protein K1T71_008963 [Dendrolimus kikuchii]|uniref:Uncharacterized protein n=1 Tax=Dendrolimus kikuchii TaxID=765133 RepID=A0ACC1CVS6_9NEOP|nr:hypothetical protein K1T71_008963 [Dendrolimus kikuchii]
MKTIIVLVVVGVLGLTEAKRFTRCELVRELRNQGFPEDQLRDWVCLVENESMGDSGIVGGVNSNGSRDYGLFQINDKYWCSNTSTPGKDCNVTCDELLTDDITTASNCAKKIYNRHKFMAWHGWERNCQKSSSLPNISSC